MTNQDIMDLVTCFDRSTARTMKVTGEGFTLELTRDEAAGACAPAPACSAPAPAPDVEEGRAVTAPLVGTYYAAPGPEQPPFVKAGDRVKKGETLCLIEAMKMMSEITAQYDGVVAEILAENGQAVGFGAPLLRLRRA